MKVHFIIPWSTEKNIGKVYNETMKMIGDDDWVCFLDGDALNTTTYFGTNIERIIKKNPEYSLFTCQTNRVIRNYQLLENVDWENNDMEYHRNIGEELWLKNGVSVEDITDLKPLSGVMILTSKETWEIIGGFPEEKMLGIDNEIHKKVKDHQLKVGLMKGVYVYHWYRNGDIKEKQHLI
jgi:hypothetical protein